MKRTEGAVLVVGGERSDGTERSGVRERMLGSGDRAHGSPPTTTTTYPFTSFTTHIPLPSVHFLPPQKETDVGPIGQRSVGECGGREWARRSVVEGA